MSSSGWMRSAWRPGSEHDSVGRLRIHNYGVAERSLLLSDPTLRQAIRFPNSNPTRVGPCTWLRINDQRDGSVRRQLRRNDRAQVVDAYSDERQGCGKRGQSDAATLRWQRRWCAHLDIDALHAMYDPRPYAFALRHPAIKPGPSMHAAGSCVAAQTGAMAQLLEQHKDRSKALAHERQQLMQKQANVLRGYVMSGIQLPVRPTSHDLHHPTFLPP